MDVVHAFAGLVVSDIDEARDWYVALLGREADIVPNDVELMWQLTPTANLYLLADPKRAGGGVFTMAVKDLELEVRQLMRRGLEPGPIQPAGEGAIKSILTDPDHNQIHLIQVG